jgi:thioredoxin reductase (NADPH)
MEPSNVQIAEKIGLKTRAQMPFYDLVIVGAGPKNLATATGKKQAHAALNQPKQ